MPNAAFFARISGCVALTAVFLLDQGLKALMLAQAAQGIIPKHICSVFNLVLVHNYGISFGILAHGKSWMPLALTLATSLVAIALVVWMLRTQEYIMAVTLGFLAGGAWGNIVDRARYGSVTDFLDFHWESYHWPAFNVADSAIFMGVVLLLLISIVRPAERKEAAQ